MKKLLIAVFMMVACEAKPPRDAQALCKELSVIFAANCEKCGVMSFAECKSGFDNEVCPLVKRIDNPQTFESICLPAYRAISCEAFLRKEAPSPATASSTPEIILKIDT